MEQRDRDRLQIMFGVLFFAVALIVVGFCVLWLRLPFEKLQAERTIIGAEAEAEAIRVIGAAAREYPEGAAYRKGAD